MIQLSCLKGVGAVREKALAELGILSVESLISYFPYRYVDLRNTDNVFLAEENSMVLAVAEIVAPPVLCYGKNKSKFIRASGAQEGKPFTLLWFHAEYVKAQLHVDESYIFYGRVTGHGKGLTLVNPSFEPLKQNKRLKGVMPIYSLAGKLSQWIFYKIMQEALQNIELQSVVPERIWKERGLDDIAKCYREVHMPTSPESAENALHTLRLERFVVNLWRLKKSGGAEEARTRFYQIQPDGQAGIGLKLCQHADFNVVIGESAIGLLQDQSCNEGDTDRKLKKHERETGKWNENTQKILNQFERVLPYTLTLGQKQVMEELVNDFLSDQVMNRLVQGDVGCGKTVVALFAGYFAVRCGYQIAMLAPTEVLAKQHFEKAKQILGALGVRVGLLIGALNHLERARCVQGLASGGIDFVVGTHALLSKDVEFANLQLVICDEQQRFGVKQRASLMQKSRAVSGSMCDILSMTATPIPRTLGLALTGRLTLSTIMEKPMGRADVHTSLVPVNKQADMLGFIANQARAGHASFLVCPYIGGEEECGVAACKDMYEKLTKDAFKGLHVGLLYGSMKSKAKAEMIENFLCGKVDILISTTVVEVGVDVPRATVMCIYNAERYGLAQLHQLRGRIGRGTLEGWCFLCTHTTDRVSLARLDALKMTTDGFALAETDFKQRGPGELLGVSQHGFANELEGLSSQELTLAVDIANELENMVLEEKNGDEILDDYVNIVMN